jgi:hypothetical protein
MDSLNLDFFLERISDTKNLSEGNAVYSRTVKAESAAGRPFQAETAGAHGQILPQ